MKQWWLKTFDLCAYLFQYHLSMTTNFNRRHFLRGAGALIALPALESIGFRRFASAAAKATGAIPKRAVFMGIGFGVTKQTWYPDKVDTGAGYKLSEGRHHGVAGWTGGRAWDGAGG